MQSMILRSFIAIEIPSEVQASIGRSIANLQKALPRPLVRWVATRNMHLTLKFLGDVSPANLEQLTEALQAEAARQTGFELEVGNIGAFPTPRRARVLWVGIEAPAALSALQHSVESAAARMGYPSEERPFSPHLTIGRVGQNISAAELTRVRTALEATHVGALGSVRVDALHIFKSDLQPGGAVYTSLYTLPLKSQ
jgi:2'-5' RNA ligase